MRLRKLVSLWCIATAAILSAGTASVKAQAPMPMPCEKWIAPLGVEPGQLVDFIDSESIGDKVEGFAYLGDEIIPGRFVRIGANPSIVVAFWGVPLDAYKGYLQFTIARGAELLFQPADRRKSPSPIPVDAGFTKYKIKPHRQTCAVMNAGEMVTVGRAPIETADDADLIDGPGTVAGGWSTMDRDERRPPPAARIIRIPPSKPATPIDSLITKSEEKRGEALGPLVAGKMATPPKSDETEPMAPPEDLKSKEARPVVAGKAVVGICQHPAMTKVTSPWKLSPEILKSGKPLLVGKRTAEPKARLYEDNEFGSYLDKGEVPLEGTTSKMTVFIQSGKLREERSGDKVTQIIPVTIPGLTLTAPVAAPKAGVTLNIMVVGAPEEITVSGLERIGKQLEADETLDIKLKIDWHEVTPTGDVRPSQPFESFGALVREARGKSKEGFFITPDERQFTGFMSEFKSLLSNRSQPLDRVIWVKGAYKFPNTTPVLVQTLIDTAASTRSIPKTPSGDAERWLYVITARMPGFSINYVKEPVNASNAGEVYSEREVGGATRRLVDGAEATSLVRNLSGVALMRSKSGSAPPKPVVAKYVLNANQIFAERGYLMSVDDLQALNGKLQSLSKVWSEDGVRSPTDPEQLRAAGVIADASIQSVVEPFVPLLDPFSTGVITKPISSLSTAEDKDAAAIVKAMLKLTEEKAAEMIAESDGVPLHTCQLVYMSTKQLMSTASLPALKAAPVAEPPPPPRTLTPPTLPVPSPAKGPPPESLNPGHLIPEMRGSAP